MTEPNPSPESQTLAFLRIWTESFAKLGQAAFAFSPDAVPPEMLRQIRAGIFQALAHSWDEYLRSPQFLESMKETMESGMAMRTFTTEFLSNARRQMGGAGLEEVDGVILAIRELERRVLERLNALGDELAGISRRLTALETALGGIAPRSRRAKDHARRRKAPRKESDG